MRKKQFVILLSCIALCAASLNAVEISLDNFKVEGSKSSSNIGYVDMDKIFQSHPLTKRLQDDFAAEADKRKKVIDEAQKDISETERIISSSSTITIQVKIELDALRINFAQLQAQPAVQPVAASTEAAAAVSVSTEPAKPVIDAAMVAAKENELKEIEKGIEAMKKDLEKKRYELGKLIERNRKDLEELEEKHTASVLQDLYDILEKITVEENLSMIVDKNNVLYGHPGQEYTDKVLERLRGR